MDKQELLEKYINRLNFLISPDILPYRSKNHKEYYDYADALTERFEPKGKDIDQEEAHREADEILCELLVELGYKEVAAVYERVEKLYS